jgi:rfaE bifunctional protein nucleotidyltransferase chain/domain
MEKTVFTNGCFDILHRGHIEYLQEAKSKGDILIVGLNSDNSIKRLKGDDRPLNNQEDRKIMLLALKSVDQVIVFEEDTPINLIREIKPDILVKGGDWEIKDIIGHEFVLENGGKVLSLPYREGYSTTNIINKIRGEQL